MWFISFTECLSSLELGLIYALVGLGVYLSFKTLQFPDLSVDGTFPLGACVCGVMILAGYSPLIATCCAFMAGFLMGTLTAWLSTKLKLLNLLSGILVMTALYSVNLRIMDGKPNISLLGSPTLFEQDAQSSLLLLVVITAVIVLLLYGFLSTHLGLSMRATGANQKMARAQGINDTNMIQLGLGLSNGLVALSGALFAQHSGIADVTLGVGTIIMGLASVILGESILPTRRLSLILISCVLGSILYKFTIAMALNFSDFGFKASDTNLVTSVLVAVAMLIPTFKKKLFKKGTLS